MKGSFQREFNLNIYMTETIEDTLYFKTLSSKSFDLQKS